MFTDRNCSNQLQDKFLDIPLLISKLATFSLQKFRAHNISLVELRTLNEKHLEAIGIPLGVRVRLLEEAMELEPVTPVS